MILQLGVVWNPVDLALARPRGVVALGEIDGMPHPALHPPNPGFELVSAIPEICPPGEGMVVWTALRLLM